MPAAACAANVEAGGRVVAAVGACPALFWCHLTRAACHGHVRSRTTDSRGSYTVGKAGRLVGLCVVHVYWWWAVVTLTLSAAAI